MPLAPLPALRGLMRKGRSGERMHITDNVRERGRMVNPLEIEVESERGR